MKCLNILARKTATRQVFQGQKKCPLWNIDIFPSSGDSIDRDMGTSPKLATAETAAVFTMAMDETFEDVVPGCGEQGSWNSWNMLEHDFELFYDFCFFTILDLLLLISSTISNLQWLTQLQLLAQSQDKCYPYSLQSLVFVVLTYLDMFCMLHFRCLI